MRTSLYDDIDVALAGGESRRWNRLLLTVAGAFGFGLFAALVAGQGSDGLSAVASARNQIGNLSAPWLIVALAAGAASQSVRAGVLFGSVATVSALLGFYVVTAFVTDVGGRGVADDFARLLLANRLWFVLGAISGPTFGALGAWVRAAPWMTVGIISGSLMIGEPVMLAIIGVVYPATAVGRDAISLSVHVAEALLGIAVVAAGWMRLSSERGAVHRRTTPRS
jgi:hypothetical protein